MSRASPAPLGTRLEGTRSSACSRIFASTCLSPLQALLLCLLDHAQRHGAQSGAHASRSPQHRDQSQAIDILLSAADRNASSFKPAEGALVPRDRLRYSQLLPALPPVRRRVGRIVDAEAVVGE